RLASRMARRPSLPLMRAYWSSAGPKCSFPPEMPCRGGWASCGGPSARSFALQMNASGRPALLWIIWRPASCARSSSGKVAAMSDQQEKPTTAIYQRLSEKVGAREKRRIRARNVKDRTLWVGLGAFGVVGWSVAVPTVVGIVLGLWLDRLWPARFS